MATAKSSNVTPAAAFFDIPLSLITVAEQIRSRIDQEGEEFLALVESIREKGVLESIIVTPRDGNYMLIAGADQCRDCSHCGYNSENNRQVTNFIEKILFAAESPGGDPNRPAGRVDRHFPGLHLCSQP